MGAERPKFALLAVTLLAVLSVAGCRVVSVAEDNAMRDRAASGFDADRYVDGLWASQATPYWSEHRQPVASVVMQVRRDISAAGRSHGRRAGDGSPWVFVVAGEGVVEAVQPGRQGRATIRVPGLADRIVLQTGPVVSGAVLRDSLPFVRFDDFANQLVYADVAQALTNKALKQTQGAARQLVVGDTVRFEGVAPFLDATDAVLVTPYSLSRSAS